MGAGHHHGKDGDGGALSALALALAVAGGIALAASGLLPSVAGISTYTLAALVGAAPLVANALRELRHLRLSADLAVLIAAAAAVAIGQPFVAAEVILIMLVGGFLEAIAVRQTRGAIRALIRLAPQEATRVGDGQRRERIPISAIRTGDRVAVAPGERIPVDGRAIAGRGTVDQSALTGESIPVDVAPGSRVLAGSLNGSAALEIETEAVGEDTAFGRMIHLVEEAENRRAPAQRLADRYANFFLPAVLACAAIAYFAGGGDVVRAVSVLVIACPCALVLATPTAIAAGIGRLARAGVLVKGGGALEALARARSILLDKTGTLTLARLHVSDLIPAPGIEPDDLLARAGAVEAASDHPLARAIVEEIASRGGHPEIARDIDARPGLGIRGLDAGGRVIRAGSLAFLQGDGIRIPETLAARARALDDGGHSLVLVAADERCLGIIAARDRPRPEAPDTVAQLRHLFEPDAICILTGDGPGAARALAAQVGIDDVRTGLLPEQKTEIVERFRSERGPTIMVGDGINDAAALATADVGIALTDVGSDAAIEASDIAVFGERHLAKLPQAIVFSRRVLRVVHQNIVAFAFGANAVGVGVAASGIVGPVAAAILHQVSSLLVVANSLRLLWSAPDATAGLAKLARLARTFARRAARPALALALAGYLLSGFYLVRPDEIGVVRFLGRALRPHAAPGIHYRAPWPLTRLSIVQPSLVRRVEIGFRTDIAPPDRAPPAYEWNLQHRDGRYRLVAEEAIMTCGDQGLLDVHAVVHFRANDPQRFLFAAADPIPTLAAAAESCLRGAVAARTLGGILTADRAAIEEDALRALGAAMRRYDVGIEPLGVHLQDVHPPIDVVPTFRKVIDALEEKDAIVNQAQAYANERIPIARGTATKLAEESAAAATLTVDRAEGEATSFTLRAQGRATLPDAIATTDFQIYADTLERALAQARVTLLPDTPATRTGVTLLNPDTLRQLPPPIVPTESTATGTQPPEEAPSQTP